LGTGALVGIIIAAIVIIALIGAIAFFMWKRKKNAAATASHHAAPTAAGMSGTPLMSGGPIEHYKPHAYPDTYAHQVQPGAYQYPAELSAPPSYAQPVVHEMGTQK
jgi:flagellar basal body-associated protein FliL